MAKIAEDDTFTQVVRFDVPADKQIALIEAIAGEVERWVQHSWVEIQEALVRRGIPLTPFPALSDLNEAGCIFLKLALSCMAFSWKTEQAYELSLLT
jgi:hypothetical protein